VSLIKRGNVWHFAFRWNGRRYRGSCKTFREQEAKKVEALVLARLLEDVRLPWNRKVPTLAGFSNRFFNWLESLPADRPPKPPTRRYYRVGWQLLESKSIAGMKLDHITADHALTIEGSSAANTNNVLRTLRRMLKKAQEWQPSSVRNGRDGRHRQCDGSDGCDGASVRKHRAHLHALEREADQGSDRAAESVVN
jgi:hypothetical protein